MKRFRQTLAICITLILLTGTLAPKSGWSITPSQEEDLTREFLYYTFQNYKIIQDPTVTEYVDRIGYKILKQMPQQPFRYHFYVIQQDEYNAFAGPAGHIFINSGLLNAMDSEDELAGILAHEISHVTCRHISQMIDRSKITSMATLAGIAAGILLGIGGAPEAASAVTVGSVAAGHSVSLAYSRESEMQADQVGLKYIEDAGYNVAALLKILKKIRNKTWYGTDQVPTYLVTHPATEDRIAYIGAWLQAKNRPAAEPEKKQGHDFQIMKSRILALYTEKSVAYTQLANTAGGNDENPYHHYAQGLFLSRSGDRKDAIVHLKKALEQRPFDQTFIRDLGITYFLDGQYTQALKYLKSSKTIPDFDPEGELYLARALKELGRTKEAISGYTNLLAQKPQFYKTHYYLGELYGETGRLGEAHYHLGVYYKQERNYKNAVFHLKKALAILKDKDKKETARKMLKTIAREREQEPRR